MGAGNGSPNGDGAERHRAKLLAALGVPLAPELLERALTHRSYAYENGGLPTNERLEFLGDSVLGLVVTDTLFREHPDLPEGQLAKLRAAVVQMRALAGVARGLRLGAYIRLGRGEEGTGGRDKPSILADTLEAVIGAVYTDHGLDAASKLVHRLFDPVIANSARLGAGLDWKTSLQELTAAELLGVPEYRVEESGPDHQKSFRATVRVAGRRYGSGEGRSKKEAEQQAAEAAYTAISQRQPDPGGRLRSPHMRRTRTSGSTLPPGTCSTWDGQCLSFPRSRPCGAAWSATWPAARWPPRTVLHPRAVRRHLAGPDDFEAAMAGRMISAARRRGKYLWLSAGEDALLAHLGMSGQFLVGDPDRPVGPHVRARFTFADAGPDLRFTDQRTFGHLSFVPGGSRAARADRAHRARPAGARLRPRGPGRAGCACARPGSSGRCSTSR